MMRRGTDLVRSEDGAVAPLVAIGLFVLVASAGIAFDYSRIASLDTELQNAADQAALAAATQLDEAGGSRNRATAAAEALVENLTFFGNDGNAAGTDVNITQVVFYANQQAAVADTTADNPATTQVEDGTYCPPSDLTGTVEAQDAAAAFVCVRTTTRAAAFALTPVVGAMGGEASAMAVASIGAAVCRVPPLMICNPKPNPALDDKITDDVPSLIGAGFRVTGHGNTKLCTGKGNAQVTDPETGELVDCSQNVGAWAPGDFGFLEVGSGQNADLIRALAYDTLTFDCLTDTGQRVETGNPQSLYDAVNTRFDIYDFNANGNNDGTNNGNVLSACANSGTCPPAANTVKDVINSNPPSSMPGVGDNKCKFRNAAGGGGGGGGGQPGWRLPSVQYAPRSYDVVNPLLATNALSLTHNGGVASTATPAPANNLTIAGYPRDLCHYNSYNTHSVNSDATTSNDDPSLNTNCGGSFPLKIGNGRWGRGDYFRVNHPTITPPAGITRFETYRWELGDNIYRKDAMGNDYLYFAGGTPRLPTAGGQRSAPVCNNATSSIDRRVLSVAVVNNCSSLSGASTPVVIGEYVDMFLVQPIIDGGANNVRGNGDVKDSIYMELIGPAGSGSSGAQTVQRRVPYLVK